MSKRSRKESIGDRPDGVPLPSASKRTKAADSSDDALELILGKADELISCIRELKTAKKKHKGPAGLKLEDLEESAKTNIITLAQTLLPALQGLATATEEESTKKADAGAIMIPSTGMVTKWESRVIQPALLPPLPKVLDQTLEIAALTHSGKTGNPSDPSYERLEWIGDAYVYLIASSLVYQTFPKMDPGKCSQARELLIRNSTLAQYSIRYGLDKRANFPEEFGMGGRKGGSAASDKQRVKARGDIFESYVGAIILSDPENGVQRTCDWLKTLWGSELLKDIRKEENTEAVPETQISSKTELERSIVVPGIKIEYRDIPCTKKDKRNNLPLFAVACVLHGWGEEDKQLGFGCARGKKEAGQKAAQMALENKKMLKIYRDKKAAWLRARDEEEAAAEPASRAQADEEDSSRAQAKE